MKKIVLSAFAFALIASGTAFAVDWAKHPHLHHAHNAIDNAKKALQEANDKKRTEFGGHRAKAIELLNQAQQEIEQAVAYADSNAP